MVGYFYSRVGDGGKWDVHLAGRYRRKTLVQIGTAFFATSLAPQNRKDQAHANNQKINTLIEKLPKCRYGTME